MVSAGQKSLKIDVALGWKPTNFRPDGFSHEAIEIKISYPEHKNVIKTSIRHSNIFNDMSLYQKGKSEIASYALEW